MENVLQSNLSHQGAAIKPHADIEQHSASEIATPLTPIEYPEAIRFEQPVPATYSLGASITSILSLVFMSAVSTLMFLALAKPEMQVLPQLAAYFSGWQGFSEMLLAAYSSTFALWVILPFAFTIFGSTLGWVFELGLLLSGTPFQLRKSPLARFITQVRLLNLAPVAATISFFIVAMAIPESNLRTAWLLLSGATCFGLGFGLLFATQSLLMPLLLTGSQLLQAAIVLAYSAHIPGIIVALLVGQSLLQFSMLVLGTSTPVKSTIFHITTTIAGTFLFLAILYVSAGDSSFSMSVAPDISAGSLLMWGFVLACLIGLVVATKMFADAYNNFRALLSNAVWAPIYFKLVSAKRFPNPINLSTVYDKTAPKRTHLKPYYQAHPLHLMQSLSIPAVADKNIEGNVKVFSKLLKQVQGAFKLIGFLDHTIPQANVAEPIKNKPRLPIWSSGRDFWPKLFQMKLFGNTLPNRGEFAETPKAALAAFKEGQLLAYLAESGVANPFIQPAEIQGEGLLKMDFRFLEKYEFKADYEPYGGVAYFKVNSDAQKLELVSIIAPHSTKLITASPHNPEFRRAESLVVASMYYEVISGKHLAEIHMTYNLVEVAMHNAFDAQNQWTHPFRSFMYLHFFSHELAEEMTTEHLVQEGAVFSQVFATTHDGMVNHLNDSYSKFLYGVDEDFEARAALMKMRNGDLLPHSCIKWEMEYFDIWLKYTTNLIDIIYADNAAVQNDAFLQDFHKGLQQVFFQGLPERYHDFQTKQGVARFAADTIHHAVVRHQVYGTTGIRAALDPRISSTQIPKDTGTPAVDEWRSLAFVALATGEARFTLLTGDKGKDFTYLLEGVDEQYRKPMIEVFNQLQVDLLTLDEQWTKGVVEKDFNYNYFRAIPTVLHTGPGY